MENALLSVATYEIVKGCGLNMRLEKTERVRDTFEVFEVEDLAYFDLDPRSS